MTISSSYKDDSHLLLWNTSWSFPDQKKKGWFALQVDAFVSVDTTCQQLDAVEMIIMLHVWWEVILSVWVTGTTLIKVPLIWCSGAAHQEQKERRAPLFMRSLIWHHQDLGDQLFCVCVSVHIRECVWQVQSAFGPVPPISSTHTLFLACYPPSTYGHAHTLLNYMSCWSVEFICILLRSAPFSRQQPSFFYAITSQLTPSQDCFYYVCLSVPLPAVL